MDLQSLLVQLGINVGSNAIYDLVKGILGVRPKLTKLELEAELILSLKTTKENTDKIIDILLKDKNLEMVGNTVIGNNNFIAGGKYNTAIGYGNRIG